MHVSSSISLYVRTSAKISFEVSLKDRWICVVPWHLYIESSSLSESKFQIHIIIISGKVVVAVVICSRKYWV
jgi:hypothetical protein